MLCGPCPPPPPVRFRPKLPPSRKRRHLQQIAALESATCPTWMLLARDFYMTMAPGTPLHSALADHGCLHHVLRLLPDGTATQYTRRGATDTATAIDHIFTAGAVAEAEAAVFPITSAHRAILARVHLLSGDVDAFAWKRYRRRALPPVDLARVVALLDVYWVFLALTAVHPDTYIAAAHQVADTVVPLRRTPKAELESLAPQPSAWRSFATYKPRSRSGPNSTDTGPALRLCRLPPSQGPRGKPYDSRLSHFSPSAA